MSEPFIGQINIFPYDFAPVNYLPCNGQLLSISAFDALYSIIGTTYGGDGRSTFALPDLRGRVPIGQGDAPGLTPRFIGQRLGAETVSLTVNQLPSHKHAFNATAAPPSQIEPSNALPAAGGQTIYAESVQAVEMGIHSLSATGNGLAHENMSPSMPLQFCICVTGIYPSRQ